MHISTDGSDAAMRFATEFIESGKRQKVAERAWVEALQDQGVMAAHPDDGWVDRVENYASLVHPQFSYGPKVGDVIALGTERKHRLVRIARIENSVIFQAPRKYFFEAVESRLEACESVLKQI